MLVYLAMLDSAEEQSKFEQIYEAYRSLMYYAAYEILHNQQDAEDAVHDAFLRIIKNMDKIQAPVCPKTKSYIVTITENRAIDLYRRQKRHPEVEYEDGVKGIQVEYTGGNDLARSIGKLPPKYRQVLILKYRHGYSPREIARILGISEANVKKLDQRAKAKLERICEEEGLSEINSKNYDIILGKVKSTPITPVTNSSVSEYPDNAYIIKTEIKKQQKHLKLE